MNTFLSYKKSPVLSENTMDEHNGTTQYHRQQSVSGQPVFWRGRTVIEQP